MDQQKTAGKTHSRDGLCCIKTAPTKDSAVDHIETTRHFTGTPVRNSKEDFMTPSNKTIAISYEMLGLTPTKMRSMTVVLDQMQADGVWDIDIKKTKTDEQAVVFRLIVFLYGKGYYTELEPQYRISRIQECITKAGGNRKRLREIAL
jgi:hypothetical protein